MINKLLPQAAIIGLSSTITEARDVAEYQDLPPTPYLFIYRLIYYNTEYYYS